MKMDLSDRVLIGDNSFIGVDHLSQERLRAKGTTLNAERIGAVLDSALTSGAQGLVCSAHPSMRAALWALKGKNYSRNFGIHLIVPDAQTQVRQASDKGMIGLLSGIMSELTWKGRTKAMASGGISALTSNPARLIRTYLDAEVSLFAKSAPGNAKIKSVFLHELFTELVVSFGMRDLADEYINFVKDSLDMMPGFVTRNFARFTDFVLRYELAGPELIVMTPFNKVGFQMNPSRDACEQALARIPDTRIIAMSILAGGYLGIVEAVNYLANLPRELSCVVGVSTEAHAKETFGLLRQKLG